MKKKTAIVLRQNIVGLFFVGIVLSYTFYMYRDDQDGDLKTRKKPPMSDRIDILQKCPLSDSFDFPVGPPDANGYYNAQKFGENNHLGEDWNGNGGGNTDVGDPVYAVADGVVFFAENIKSGWGNVVRIFHNIGTKDNPKYVESLYGHFQKVMVNDGDIVKKGQQIGTIGNVNGKYLAHLHFEMRDDINLPIGPGYSENKNGYLNPTKFIKSNRQTGSKNQNIVIPVIDSFYAKLCEAAIERTTKNVTYDPGYVVIKYPGGDVPEGSGVCTDVVVRSYRKVDIDLQKEVHEDMKRNFSKYPKIWNLKKPDTNIDHRRVPNLMKYFERQDASLAITQKASDYQPGDLVAWNLYGGVNHIGVVVNIKSQQTERFMIVHNIGRGPMLEDVLFNWKIIGHYRLKK